MQFQQIPLSKTLALEDYDRLQPEVEVVEVVGLGEQHPHRVWEYAMALRAIKLWRASEPARAYVPRLYDVGGAGSRFALMANARALALAEVVDPNAPAAPFSRPVDLQTFVLGRPPLADIVTCLSVIEHVPDWSSFLTDLVSLLRPGGLLFLTMDSCECSHLPEADPHHFHWMRERIATPGFRVDLLALALLRGCEVFGALDASSSGPQVFDYNFSSLALIKKERP